MKYPKPRVLTHDGHRSNERPSAVIWEDQVYEVMHTEYLFISTGIESTSPVKRGFLVHCRGGARFKLVLEEGSGWIVELLPGPRSLIDL